MASEIKRCWRCHHANPYEVDWYTDACAGCIDGMVDWSRWVGDAWWIRRVSPLYSIGEAVLCWWRRRQIALGVY